MEFDDSELSAAHYIHLISREDLSVCWRQKAGSYNLNPDQSPWLIFVVQLLVDLFQISHTLLHRIHKKCVALHPQTSHLSLMPCDTVNTYQQWTFKELQPKYWTGLQILHLSSYFSACWCLAFIDLLFFFCMMNVYIFHLLNFITTLPYKLYKPKWLEECKVSDLSWLDFLCMFSHKCHDGEALAVQVLVTDCNSPGLTEFCVWRS